MMVTATGRSGLILMLSLLLGLGALLPGLTHPRAAEAAAFKPDLYVSRIETYVDPVSGLHSAEVTITNQARRLKSSQVVLGSQTAAAGPFYVDMKLGDTVLYRHYVAGGVAGGQTYVFRVFGVNCSPRTIIVDSTGSVVEENESNNLYLGYLGC